MCWGGLCEGDGSGGSKEGKDCDEAEGCSEASPIWAVWLLLKIQPFLMYMIAFLVLTSQRTFLLVFPTFWYCFLTLLKGYQNIRLTRNLWYFSHYCVFLDIVIWNYLKLSSFLSFSFFNSAFKLLNVIQFWIPSSKTFILLKYRKLENWKHTETYVEYSQG